ncbi:MAG: ATP-binding cassette domain-containing protein [Gammaproteobacteria bacterium]
MNPIIDVANLSYSFGCGALQRRVLHNINFGIKAGESIILTGPSGSGKTTFLTIIGGLRHANIGHVKVLGKQLVNSTERTKISIRQQIGCIFQHHNLLKSLTALQNVSLALEMRTGLTERERLNRSAEMLEAVGLDGRLHYKPDELSGGQLQRVSIARALVSKPKIILADELTASLDKKNGHQVVSLLKQLANESNTALLIVTHDARLLDMSDKVLELEDGTLKTYRHNSLEAG